MSMLVRRGRRALTAALVRPRPRELALRTSQAFWLPSRASPVSYGPLEPTYSRRWLSTSTTTTDLPPTATEDEDEPAMKPKNEKDALFLHALRLYYEKEGHFFVPTDFVVPSTPTPDDPYEWPEELWGVPLGMRVRNFARGISNDYKRAMLKSVGFPYDDWKTYVWEEQLLPSLRLFKETVGHTFVRFPYVVPENNDRFPKCTWGFKLGFAVALLRQQRETLTPAQLERLQEIDFIWTENHFKLKILFLPALKRFKEIFGHTEVPTKFVVPTDDVDNLWHENLRDTKLGYLYGCLKSGFFDHDTIQNCVDDLHAVGAFEAESAERAWRAITVPALAAFAEIEGHTEIPRDFIVPHAAPWPEATWGYHLGYVVHCMFKESIFSEQIAHSKPALRALGYRWDVLFGRWSRQLLPGLRAYRNQYDHCDVPATFIVPNDAPWPEEARKYHLGRQLQLVRKLGRESPEVADALDELDALGFKFNVVESDFREKILPALHAYAAKYGTCDVPRGFVVPSDASWPEKAWGLKLGTAASAIRARKQYRKQVDEHRNELKALGFSWPMPQTTTGVDREVVQPCIAIYKELYGDDAMPDPDFVVPANDNRWPVEASGFKLGRWLQTHSRRRRMSMDAAIRDAGASTAGAAASIAAKRTMRRTQTLEPHQEQYWNEVLMASFQAYADVHGSCRDMDDNFVIPSEAPFPQIAWGLNLGLRLRYVRHHDRYAAEVDKYRAELAVLGVVESSSATSADDSADE